jgi:hypothetical protein
VHALRPEIARERFRENALSRLGRRESGEIGLATLGGCVARHDDGAVSRRDHRGRRQSRQMKERHRVGVEIASERFGVDVEEGAESAADSVVDDHPGLANRDDRALESCSVRHVARYRHRIRDFLFERDEAVGITRQHGHAIAAFGEASRHGGARPRSDARDQREWFGRRHAHAASSGRARCSRTKSRRSLPKNIASPTNMVGEPNTPR